MRVLLNIALCVAFLSGATAWAQSSSVVSQSSALMSRRIPKEAPRAGMVVSGPHVLNLNGLDYSLKPGSQIFNEKNRIVQPQSLATNLRYDVRVQIDSDGRLRKIWMLTDEEKAVPAPILK